MKELPLVDWAKYPLMDIGTGAARLLPALIAGSLLSNAPSGNSPPALIGLMFWEFDDSWMVFALRMLIKTCSINFSNAFHQFVSPEIPTLDAPNRLLEPWVQSPTAVGAENHQLNITSCFFLGGKWNRWQFNGRPFLQEQQRRFCAWSLSNHKMFATVLIHSFITKTVKHYSTKRHHQVRTHKTLCQTGLETPKPTSGSCRNKPQKHPSSSWGYFNPMSSNSCPQKANKVFVYLGKRINWRTKLRRGGSSISIICGNCRGVKSIHITGKADAKTSQILGFLCICLGFPRVLAIMGQTKKCPEWTLVKGNKRKQEPKVI